MNERSLSLQHRKLRVKKPRKSRTDYNIRNIAAGLGSVGVGTQAAGLAKAVPNALMVSGLKKGLVKFKQTPPKVTDEIQKALKTDAKIHVWTNKRPVNLAYPSRGTTSFKNIAFNREMSKGRFARLKAQGKTPIRNLVAVSPDMNKLPILAHELGHASTAFRMPAGKLLYAVSKKAPLIGTLVAGFSDPDSKKSKYAPLGVGVASLPVLYEEGRASTLGYRALKKAGLKQPKTLKATRSILGKAFGTYALAAAGGVGATMLARKARRLLKNRERTLKKVKK